MSDTAKVITWGATYWPIFLIITSIAFLAPEILALVTNHANTLSDYSWKELGLPLGKGRIVHNAAWVLSLGAFLTGVFFLTNHIWFQRFK